VRDELNEGDQILVKVLGLEGKQNQAQPEGDTEGAAEKLKKEETAKG